MAGTGRHRLHTPYWRVVIGSIAVTAAIVGWNERTVTSQSPLTAGTATLGEMAGSTQRELAVVRDLQGVADDRRLNLSVLGVLAGARVTSEGTSPIEVDRPQVIRPGELLLFAAPNSLSFGLVSTPGGPVTEWNLPVAGVMEVNSTPGGTSRLALRLRAREGARLMPVPGGGFEGELLFRVEDVTDTTRTDALPAPVILELTVPRGTAAPDRVTIGRLGLPSERVTLKTGSTESRLRVNVEDSLSLATPTALDIPIVKPRVAITTSTTQLLGCGIDTATLTLRAQDLPDKEGTLMPLAASGGRLEPDGPVALDSRGQGTVKLRADCGRVTSVKVTDARFEANDVIIDVVWPTFFVVVAAFGGVAGASLRSRKPGIWAFLGLLVRGAIAGLVAAVTTTVGINLLPVSPSATSGYALYLAVGAVGGLFGLVSPTPKGRSAKT